MCILYKPGLELHISDWLSVHNHTGNRDQEIAGISASKHTINTMVDLPTCASIEMLELQWMKMQTADATGTHNKGIASE